MELVEKKLVRYRVNSMNKAWLRDNLLKAALAIGFLILASFYFLILAPNKERKEDLANAIKCQNEGEQLYDKERKNAYQGTIYSDPEFRFNKELNTCLYLGSEMTISSSGSYLLERFIKDVFTRENLIVAITVEQGGKTTQSKNTEEYNFLVNKYFRGN